MLKVVEWHLRSGATVVAIAMAVAGSCATAPQQAVRASAQVQKERTVRVGQNFNLRISETVAIEGEPLRVTFERVVEDSRCPTNTTCIWAGDGVVRLTLLGANAESGTLNLHTASDTAAEGSFQKFRLRLVQLAPTPHDGGGIPAEQYVATLIVS